MFATFEELLDAKIEAAIAAGVHDVGVEALTAESFRITERRVVYTHPASGAETICCRVEQKERNHPLPLAEALEMACGTGARLLVNEQSHRAAVQVPAASWMDDDGHVVPRTRLIRPMLREAMTADEFSRSHWRVATRDAFTAQWNAELAQVPEFSESSFHIVAGLLLPIWGRLPSESMRVYRFETEAGERVIGRLVLSAWVDAVFDRAPTMTPDEAWTAVMDGRTVLQLADDLQVRRSRSMGENRFEVTGFSDGMVDRLKAMGLLSEIVAWRLRLFIPTGEGGRGILEQVMQRHPLVRVADRAAA